MSVERSSDYVTEEADVMTLHSALFSYTAARPYFVYVTN